VPYGHFQRLLSGVFFSGVVLFSGSVAAEQRRHFDLTWVAPAGCPNLGEVAREIDELVAGSNLTPAKSMIDASARLRRPGLAPESTAFNSVSAGAGLGQRPNSESALSATAGSGSLAAASMAGSALA